VRNQWKISVFSFFKKKGGIGAWWAPNPQEGNVLTRETGSLEVDSCTGRLVEEVGMLDEMAV
jgi:hypothetical protein